MRDFRVRASTYGCRFFPYRCFCFLSQHNINNEEQQRLQTQGTPDVWYSRCLVNIIDYVLCSFIFGSFDLVEKSYFY